MIYAQLFWSFLQIGLFSIGGGYAVLPLIQEQTVYIREWISIIEFTDLITIAEMTPGPIAINAATFVGIQVAGPGGAVVATVGCITPPCIIVFILAAIYKKYKSLSVMQGILRGLRPAVVALIASAGLSIVILAFWGEVGITAGIASINFISVGLFAVSLFLMKRFKLSPIYIMLGCGVIGGLIYYLLL